MQDTRYAGCTYCTGGNIVQYNQCNNEGNIVQYIQGNNN